MQWKGRGIVNIIKTVNVEGGQISTRFLFLIVFKYIQNKLDFFREKALK